MISRTEINNRMNNNSEGHITLTEVLTDLLTDVESVEFNTEVAADANDEVIEAARNELTEGGFGDDETEETFEVDTNLLEGFFSGRVKKNYQMLANADILKTDGTEYEAFGIYRDETEKYYLLSDGVSFNEAADQFNVVGLIVSNDHFTKLLNKEVDIEGYDFFGSFINDGWVFFRTDEKRSHITLNFFDMVTRLFSRNTGLLESSVMNAKSALIVGCGSVGSFIALELARAGVGSFILVDSDTLEIHNICRHQLGFRDLGRYKVDAVADAIRNINPSARITKYRGILQDMPTEYLDGFEDGIVIGTGDNRESSAFGNDLAKALQVPFVSTGCWQRAHAGECFYWYPNAGLPLYREAFANLISDERPTAHQNYFADDNDEETLNFEPGVSTDIEFVTLVAVKIIYDLLNRDTDNYTKRVIGYLKNYTLVCNTNETVIGGKNAEIFPHPLYISNTITAGKMRKEAV